ncbi:putative cytochrome P450 [Xylaria cf. heliscus]|nr:putative cytochrome P450 [Xylaria cf. heliscus]
MFPLSNNPFHRRALGHSSVIKFRLGLQPVYVVAGQRNVQAMFSSRELHYEELFVRHAFPKFWKMTAVEVQRFVDDESGPGASPLPDAPLPSDGRRYWAARQHVHYDFLGRPQNYKDVIDVFVDHFSAALQAHPHGEWRTLSVIHLCRSAVTESAINALFGPNVLTLNPDFLDAFWEFDAVFMKLILGLPAWIDPRPFRAHDRYLSMIGKYLDLALERFDWDAPPMAWEPCFGARICRELVKWLRDAGFRREAVTGALGALLFAQNSNSIPAATWMIMELAKDPSLLQAVRAEVSTACVTTASQSGPARTLDMHKLMTLPLLQSVFAETLRLRMNLNIIRNLKKPLVLDGFQIPKGSMLQTSTVVAHYDEDVWGTAQYPATTFWAERHIKYNEGGGRVFEMSGRPSNFFPFGGGSPICPGRNFAKAEIFTMVALVIDRFDIDFVKWTKLDGTPSDRAAENDGRYSAAGVVPPDRDMIIRWKRKY